MARLSIMIATLLLLMGGCTTTTVVAPADVDDPATVYLLDHGRTSSLVLPAGDHMVRYAYGDWRYYALRQRGLGRGAAALLWPTDATLGRKRMAAPATPQNIRERVRSGIEAMHAVGVSKARVEALRERLDATWEAGSDEAVVNVLNDLVFVPHPADYHTFHNSNHAVANWLEMLGAEVKGSAANSDWRVVRPQDR